MTFKYFNERLLIYQGDKVVAYFNDFGEVVLTPQILLLSKEEIELLWKSIEVLR